MGCNCSQADEDVKRYHEMIGNCDSIPANLRENKYLGLETKLLDYSKSSAGGY